MKIYFRKEKGNDISSVKMSLKEIEIKLFGRGSQGSLSCIL